MNDPQRPDQSPEWKVDRAKLQADALKACQTLDEKINFIVRDAVTPTAAEETLSKDELAANLLARITGAVMALATSTGRILGARAPETLWVDLLNSATLTAYAYAVATKTQGEMNERNAADEANDVIAKMMKKAA